MALCIRLRKYTDGVDSLLIAMPIQTDTTQELAIPDNRIRTKDIFVTFLMIYENEITILVNRMYCL